MMFDPLSAVAAEMEYQKRRHTDRPKTVFHWNAVLMEEIFEGLEVLHTILATLTSRAFRIGSLAQAIHEQALPFGARAKLTSELVQVAAVCLSWCQALDAETPETPQEAPPRFRRRIGRSGPGNAATLARRKKTDPLGPDGPGENRENP